MKLLAIVLDSTWMSNLLCTHLESSCARNRPRFVNRIQSLWMEHSLHRLMGKRKKEKSTGCCWKYSPLERATGYVHIKRLKSARNYTPGYCCSCDAIQLSASQTIRKQVTTISNFTTRLTNVSPRIKICLQGCARVRVLGKLVLSKCKKLGSAVPF